MSDPILHEWKDGPYEYALLDAPVGPYGAVKLPNGEYRAFWDHEAQHSAVLLMVDLHIVTKEPARVLAERQGSERAMEKLT